MSDRHSKSIVHQLPPSNRSGVLCSVRADSPASPCPLRRRERRQITYGSETGTKASPQPHQHHDRGDDHQCRQQPRCGGSETG